MDYDVVVQTMRGSIASNVGYIVVVSEQKTQIFTFRFFFFSKKFVLTEKSKKKKKLFMFGIVICIFFFFFFLR